MKSDNSAELSQANTRPNLEQPKTNRRETNRRGLGTTSLVALATALTMVPLSQAFAQTASEVDSIVVVGSQIAKSSVPTLSG
ncbi:hypothetical protein [Brevundimonas nasdae]|uniref:TonB-dependent receptor n=1 Tax=Brevundimonas nasdae TaxID=172043 RepID=A0ABX8TIJ1_9CAUL|nr:hypothetical protein [Brevundimonas nasdae]QYC10479.1 hypothetical protein KWG56_00140 [Brevundimonas nasdae]QYC13266.1 hypothetical protein KWG63_13695 [Brevundimonas nasdae]